MTKDILCSSCRAAIDPAKIDTERDLASCGNCGRLMDLRKARVPSQDASGGAGKARSRAALLLPVGMSLTSTSAEVVIRRRWLRAKHWLLLALFAAAAAYVAYLWGTIGASPWLVIGTLFVASFNYNLAAAFINTTVVTAGADGVNVRHGPLPTLLARNAAVEKSNIDQLYSSTHGALFAVLAKLKSGETLRLVVPLVSAEQALFVEQQLEQKLGLVDFAVEGELKDAGFAVNAQGKRPAGASSGVALVFVIPAFIASVLALFFWVAKTEVSGRLRANGALGSWVFDADDCISGQREGFGGVVLTASAQPNRLIRVVRDPVRGNLVVVASQGQPNHVVADKSCTRFDVRAERTNTNINDIWVVDGSLNIECSELSGSVTFEGCH
jgi:hypothetical protein